jgi:chromosome segregation ATPase
MAESIIAEIQELTTRVSSLNASRQAMKARMKSITTDIINAIGEIKGKNTGMKSQIQEQANQIQEKEAELAALRKQGAGHVANGADLAKQIDELGAKVAQKDQELTELKSTLSANASDKELTSKQLEQLNEKISGLETENNADKESLRKYEAEQQQLNVEMSETKGKLESAISEIRESYAALRASVEELMTEVNTDEQEKNLTDILNALQEHEEAAVAAATAVEEVPSVVATPPAEENVEGFDKFVNELDEKISRYFVLENGKYSIIPGQAIQAGNDRMIVSKAVLDKLKTLDNTRDEELLKKVNAFKRYSGISAPRPTAGGATRKRRKSNKSKKTKKRRHVKTHKKHKRGKRRTRK